MVPILLGSLPMRLAAAIPAILLLAACTAPQAPVPAAPAKQARVQPVAAWLARKGYPLTHIDESHGLINTDWQEFVLPGGTQARERLVVLVGDDRPSLHYEAQCRADSTGVVFGWLDCASLRAVDPGAAKPGGLAQIRERYQDLARGIKEWSAAPPPDASLP